MVKHEKKNADEREDKDRMSKFHQRLKEEPQEFGQEIGHDTHRRQ